MKPKEMFDLADMLVGKAKYYYVSIVLKSSYPDRDTENKIEKIAKSLQGFESGAGYGFGERDVNYIFFTQSDIKAFLAQVKSYIKSRKINVYEYYLDWQYDNAPIKLK